MHNQFGSKIRQLRETNNLLLRQVAPFINIDKPHLSKIERGERILRKETIPTLSKLFNTDEDKLITILLADQLYNIVHGKPTANEALKTVKKQIKKKK